MVKKCVFWHISKLWMLNFTFFRCKNRYIIKNRSRSGVWNSPPPSPINAAGSLFSTKTLLGKQWLKIMILLRFLQSTLTIRGSSQVNYFNSVISLSTLRSQFTNLILPVDTASITKYYVGLFQLSKKFVVKCVGKAMIGLEFVDSYSGWKRYTLDGRVFRTICCFLNLPSYT